MSYAGTTGAGGGYFIFVLDLVVLVSGRALLVSGGALLISGGVLMVSVSDGALLVSDGAPPDSGLISAGIVCTGHLLLKLPSNTVKFFTLCFFTVYTSQRFLTPSSPFGRSPKHLP